MRPLIVPVVLCTLIPILNPSAGAAEVAWQRDIEQAARDAETSKKPLLVEVSADWCGHCVKMQRTTFRDERIVKHINGCFVPVALDADADQRVVNALGVRTLPATLVVSSDGSVLKHISGFKTADQLEKELAAFCVAEETAGRVVLPDVVAEPVGSATIGVSPVEAVAPLVAFEGYCLVSMLEEERLAPGSAEHSTTYRGRTVHFASAEQLRCFQADPRKYWPELEGDCPVSALDEKTRRAGDPRTAVVHRGRLWFFAGKEREERFFVAAEDYVRRLR